MTKTNEANEDPLQRPNPSTHLNSAEEDEINSGVTQSYKTFDLGTAPSGLSVNAGFFEKFKDTVFASRPSIASIYKQSKDMSLFAYAKSQVKENRNKVIRERLPELSAAIWEEVRRTLGSAIADSVVKQLKTNHSISTVQHSSPLSHPDSLGATIMNALPYFGAHHPSFQNVLVLACSSISFNNTKFPRGHLFHAFTKNGVTTYPVSLLGHSSDSRPVIYHPPYTMSGITEAKNSLLQLARDQEITQETMDKITSLLDETYASPYPLTMNDYVDQLTVTNYSVFKKLLSSYSRHSPNLVYLSQEKIALALILNNHLSTNTAIHQLLFKKEFYELIDKYFEGIYGAFHKEKKVGTFLFWGISKDKKYRVQLWREKNMLRSADGSLEIELTPVRIRQAILNKEVVPGLLLTFIVVAFYYGLHVTGGYELTFGLTRMKEAYTALLKEVGDKENIDVLTDIPTKNLVVPRPQLLYIYEKANNLRIPATTFDLFLYGGQKIPWNILIEASKHVSLGEIIERTLPSIYREYAMKDDTFRELTERDIEQLRGLDKKIPTVISV